MTLNVYSTWSADWFCYQGTKGLFVFIPYWPVLFICFRFVGRGWSLVLTCRSRKYESPLSDWFWFANYACFHWSSTWSMCSGWFSWFRWFCLGLTIFGWSLVTLAETIDIWCIFSSYHSVIIWILQIWWSNAEYQYFEYFVNWA